MRKRRGGVRKNGPTGLKEKIKSDIIKQSIGCYIDVGKEERNRKRKREVRGRQNGCGNSRIERANAVATNLKANPLYTIVQRF